MQTPLIAETTFERNFISCFHCISKTANLIHLGGNHKFGEFDAKV